MFGMTLFANIIVEIQFHDGNQYIAPIFFFRKPRNNSYYRRILYPNTMEFQEEVQAKL